MPSDQDRTPIMGVHIDNFSKQKINDMIDIFLLSDKFNYIVTPNPEIVLKAIKNNNYRMTLNNADLVVNDGVGLSYASFLLNFYIPYRYQGVELTKYMLKKAEQKKCSLLILAKKEGLSSQEQINKYFQKNYPNINLQIHEINNEEINTQNIIDKYKPDIVFCTLGAPLQEKILEQIQKGPKLGIANGGSIDFLIGTQKRAPIFIQKIGLEWLWRLFMQPSRWKRIFNAVIYFPLFTVFWKLRSVFIYRKTIVGCIIKDNQVLIAHLSQHNRWALPQGGPDPKESYEKAVIREMNEELGIDPKLMKIKYIQNNIYRYNWTPWNRANRGYKGQIQSLGVIKFSGRNQDVTPDIHETANYKWVPIENMIDEVAPISKPSTQIIYNILKKENLI